MTNWAASTRRAGFSVRLISDTPVSFGEMEKGNCFHLFPNPAKGKFYITNVFNLKTTLVMYDLVGNQVARQELTGNKNTIDAGTLAPGVYLIRLYGSGWSVQKKLILK
jgi:hypothetical protein